MPYHSSITALGHCFEKRVNISSLHFSAQTKAYLTEESCFWIVFERIILKNVGVAGIIVDHVCSIISPRERASHGFGL